MLLDIGTVLARHLAFLVLGVRSCLYDVSLLVLLILLLALLSLIPNVGDFPPPTFTVTHCFFYSTPRWS